ncbi:response regulator [Rhizobium leguminosarum]|uniref:response regulator n=1 Tax=Rhizobium leguminosarum TaxID=384 RepID=UPI0004ACF484|nr:response regulator [Rhizobium leguminosarum]
MSLLDLLYLEESQADAIIAAIHQWCAGHGCKITDDDGKKALGIAVRLFKSGKHDGSDVLQALTEEMAAMASLARADTVLVVEDEPLVALDIESVLQAVGLPVEYCASRGEALKLIASRTPSAAILDFHLKDGEATDIAAELQARKVPLIFCSGVQKSDIPLEFREATWLCKPFSDQQLVDVVREALEIRGCHQ